MGARYTNARRRRPSGGGQSEREDGVRGRGEGGTNEGSGTPRLPKRRTGAQRWAKSYTVAREPSPGPRIFGGRRPEWGTVFVTGYTDTSEHQRGL